MLATGHSAIAAVNRLQKAGATQIKLVCLISAPEGIAAFHAAHPAIPIFTAAIDRQLDGHAYIRPGLGDAGDRLFGTK
jgi:uracil phosphoribosyltransferase